jgi:hypothetical protein
LVGTAKAGFTVYSKRQGGMRRKYRKKHNTQRKKKGGKYERGGQ